MNTALKARTALACREEIIHIEDFSLLVNLSIKVRWVKGFRGTRETPEEWEGVEVEAVLWGTTDVTAEISEEDMQRIQEQLG